MRIPPVFASETAMFWFTAAMHSRIAALTMIVVLALTPAGFAGGKKEPKVSVSFHMETEATDNPKMIFPQMTNGERRFFRRLPEIGIKDIASFNPFPSDFGGDDYGVVFQLKENAATRLAAITNANQGRWMISQINGRVTDGVMIDQQISDGKIVVWKGVKLADIHLLDKEFLRTGATKKKKN